MALVAEPNVQTTIFQLPKSVLQMAGSAGLKLTDDTGALKITAADGTTLAEAKGATPTTNDSFTTKSYVDGALGAPFRLSGTTSTVTASATIPANSYVTRVVLIVTTALDGAATISVGTSATPAAFVGTADTLPGAIGTQEYVGDTSVGGSAVTPRVTVGGAPTVGAWIAWIYYTATPRT
jgi:hypothetical protein